jgi:GTP-binding protein YchF
VNRRIEKCQKAARVSKEEAKKAEVVMAAINKIKPLLENGKPARQAELTDDEKEAIYDCRLITMKPQMYVCNVDEDGIKNGSKYIDTVKAIAAEEGADVVVICGKFEAELAEMGSPEERLEFLGELGLKESGLAVLARAAYHLMGLRTFLTAGPDECRAWTIHAGDTAPKAAGVIHTDFEKGFIKAEVYSFDDLVKYGTEAEIKAAGKYRIEGKEYIVQDGDVVFFRFNV